MLTLINPLSLISQVLISQVQTAPERISVNSQLPPENPHFGWAASGKSDLRLAQFILIPHLPELEFTHQESRPGVGGDFSNRENASGGDRVGGARSERINNPPSRSRPRGHSGNDDTPRLRLGDDDDDDDD